MGDYALHHRIAAVEDAMESVLLGLDLGILEYLLDLEKLTGVHVVSEKKALLTRAHSKKHETEEALNMKLSKDSEANLEDIEIFFCVDELFSSDNMSEQPIQMVRDGEANEIPLPV